MIFIKILFFLVSFQTVNETTFEKAEKLYQQEKYDQAKILFETYLKDNPSSYKTMEYLGDIVSL